MTDVELDERVTALEENGGGDNAQNGNKLCCGFLPVNLAKFSFPYISMNMALGSQI